MSRDLNISQKAREVKGGISRGFTKVPNRIFELALSDGALLTLLALLKRDFGGKGYVRASGSLAKERRRDERTLRRHLRELQQAGLISRSGVRISIHYDTLETKMSEGPGTKMSGRADKNVRASEHQMSQKPDQLIHSEKSPSASKKNIYKDDYIPEVRLRHPVLRAFVESPQQSRRRRFLIRRFGRELVTRALKQADLQYRHSPTEICNVFGLLFAMLAHGLDDTLLVQKEREEAERRRRERERRLRQEREDRLFRHLCEHPELWMERYVATRGRLEQLRAQYDGDLSRVITEQYGGAIRRFVIPDLEGQCEDGGWA